MIKIKTPPLHKYQVYFDKAENFDPTDKIGIYSQNKEVFQPKEIEVELDGKQAAIIVHDFWGVKFSEMTLINSLLKLTYGMSAQEMQTQILKKWKNTRSSSMFVLVLYEIKEIQ